MKHCCLQPTVATTPNASPTTTVFQRIVYHPTKTRAAAVQVQGDGRKRFRWCPQFDVASRKFACAESERVMVLSAIRVPPCRKILTFVLVLTNVAERERQLRQDGQSRRIGGRTQIGRLTPY